MAHTADQVLWLEGLWDQFLRLDGKRFLGDRAVDDSGHENDRRLAHLGMLLDVLADLVTIFFRHDHVGDDDIRRGFVHHAESAVGVMAGDDVDIFAAEGNLDYLTHGRTVINKINYRTGTHRRMPPSSCCCSRSSSISRSASSIS